MTFVLAIAMIAAPGTAGAGFADLDAIDRRIAAFTGAAVGAVGGAQTPLDRRLRLRPCQEPLALTWRSARQDSVLVQCPDPGGWRLFVPVVRPAVSTPVAPVPAPDVIARGDAVAIAVSGQGFTVSQPGEALESGAVGEWIRVRPASASRQRAEEMRARVIRPGLVAMPLP